jgi:DUF177 domain-containing protein
MKLNLAAFVEAARDVTLEARPDEIELVPPAGYDVQFLGDVKAQLRVHRVGEEFFVHGTAGTDGTFICVRCLAEFERTVECPVDLVIHRVTSPQTSGLDQESYIEIPLGTSEFDLAPYVREGILLAVPDAPHCREECLGLCSKCGANKNETTCTCRDTEPDSRWDALKKFVE